MAELDLQIDVLLDLVHRDVAGTLDHDLDVVAPGDLGQLAQGGQLGQLGLVVGVGDRARTQPVAERESHVVGGHDLAELLEVGVEEVLLMVGEAPRGEDRPAPADDARDPPGCQRHVPQEHARVDGEVVHALLCLLDDRVPVHVPAQVLGSPVDLLQGLVDGHRADRHRRVAHDPLPGGVDVRSGRQVHDGVGAPPRRPAQLLHLLGHRGGHRRVADVGVDLHQEVPTDDHGLGLGMVDVRGQDGATSRHLVADQLGLHSLAHSGELHLRGHRSPPGVVHLGDGARRTRPQGTSRLSLETGRRSSPPDGGAAVVTE